MNGKFSGLGRYISILDRLMKMYYDHELADFEIGWGQQFYVEYLYEYPGASAQEMVERFRVDKATPVSYTHLDVYKRQHHDSNGRGNRLQFVEL